MSLTAHKSKLLRICFIDGTQIGKINLNGTYLHEFQLYKGYLNQEIEKIYILNTGRDYTGFSQEQYLEIVQKALSNAFNKQVEFKEKTPTIKAKRYLKNNHKSHSIIH